MQFQLIILTIAFSAASAAAAYLDWNTMKAAYLAEALADMGGVKAVYFDDDNNFNLQAVMADALKTATSPSPASADDSYGSNFGIHYGAPNKAAIKASTANTVAAALKPATAPNPASADDSWANNFHYGGMNQAAIKAAAANTVAAAIKTATAATPTAADDSWANNYGTHYGGMNNPVGAVRTDGGENHGTNYGGMNNYGTKVGDETNYGVNHGGMSNFGTLTGSQVNSGVNTGGMWN